MVITENHSHSAEKDSFPRPKKLIWLRPNINELEITSLEIN